MDSGGGSAFASELIRQELVMAQEAGKPVIVSMGPVAASGGYWISATADEIWAEPTTITGSIGIFGLFPTFENSFEALGLHTDGVGTTPLSGGFDASRPLNPAIGSLIQQSIEDGYQQFIHLVATGRKMTPEAVDAIGQGRIWTGAQAKANGLVDQLGGLDQAIKSAASRAELEEYDVVYVKPKKEKWQEFLESFSLTLVENGWLPEPRKRLGEQLIKQLEAPLRFLAQFDDPANSYALCVNCPAQ